MNEDQRDMALNAIAIAGIVILIILLSWMLIHLTGLHSIFTEPAHSTTETPTQSIKETNISDNQLLPQGVKKFKDGSITCYTYFGTGISCLYI